MFLASISANASIAKLVGGIKDERLCEFSFILKEYLV